MTLRRRKLQRVGAQVAAKEIKIKRAQSRKIRRVGRRRRTTTKRVAIVRTENLQIRIATTPKNKVAPIANKTGAVGPMGAGAGY
jgi:hypothetical protein